MKRIAVLLITLLIVTSAVFAGSHYVRLSPAGARIDLIGEGSDAVLYNAGVNYTGYFWGGGSKAEAEPQQIPGQWASTSGYVPKRYAERPVTSVNEPVSSGFDTMGIYVGVDSSFDLKKLDSMTSADMKSLEDSGVGAQLHFGFAFRQRLGSRIMFYEMIGVTSGTWLLVGAYGEVGTSVDFGAFSLNLGARLEGGAYLPSGADFDFEKASFALGLTPYFGLGIGF